jgi:hypothetical protein
MKTKLTGALACAALAIGAFGAPAANAGTVCAKAGTTVQKYAGEQFEDVMVHMGDEATLVLGVTCSVTP